MLERITPQNHHAATGYAHAVKAGNLLFISGQTGRNVDRSLVAPGDIAAQTRRALENIATVLEAGGGTWADVAKLTIYLTDMRFLPRVREVRAAFFAEQGVEPPAITSVGVTGLATDDTLVEIEAIAVLQ
ncbi:MAG: RidA family protein [Chloroflexi bacterium]|nr:RidA family protein [Chloroflexota bacterium]